MADMTNQISNWAGGAATVSLGALQWLYGNNQQKKNERPVYEIPDEISKNLSGAENYAAQTALQGIPEEQKQQYLSNLQRSSAYGLSQLGSRNAGISGVAALNENQNQGYANLLSQDSSARVANQRYGQQLVSSARQTMADYKDQAFQINKSNPYYEKTAQNQALMGAGIQNLSQGFQQGNQGGGGDYGQQQMPQLRSVSQQQPQAYNIPTYQMSPYQIGGVNQQTTPNPYAGQKELSGTGYTGGSYW